MSLARMIPLAAVLMLPVPAFARGWHEPAGRAVGRGHYYAPVPARVVVEPRWHYAPPVRGWAPAHHRNWVAAHWAWNGFRWVWEVGYWAAVAAMTPPVVVAPAQPVYYPPPQPAYYPPQPQPYYPNQPQPQYYPNQVAPQAEMLAPGAPPLPPPAQ